MIDLCKNTDVTIGCKPTTFNATLQSFTGEYNANFEYGRNTSTFWTAPNSVNANCKKPDN